MVTARLKAGSWSVYVAARSRPTLASQYALPRSLKRSPGSRPARALVPAQPAWITTRSSARPRNPWAIVRRLIIRTPSTFILIIRTSHHAPRPPHAIHHSEGEGRVGGAPRI